MMTVNTTDGMQYGILVPHHNGIKSSGKVVRIDLKGMDNANCSDNYRMESYDKNGLLVVQGKNDYYNFYFCFHLYLCFEFVFILFLFKTDFIFCSHCIIHITFFLTLNCACIYVCMHIQYISYSYTYFIVHLFVCTYNVLCEIFYFFILLYMYISGSANASTACVFVLDLETVHPNARGIVQE